MEAASTPDGRRPPQVKPPETEVNTKSERPPLFKKPKKDLKEQEDDATPHFPGPLFPAVRRVATAPLPSRLNVSDLRVSVGDGSAEPASTSASLYDRDWVYPAFLGHHPAKSRVVGLKGSKSLNSSGRGRQVDQGGRRVVLDQKLLDVEKKSSQEIRMDSSKVCEKNSGSGTAKSNNYQNRLVIYLLAFICTVTVPYSFYLHIRVHKLQEENNNLHGLCGDRLVGSIGSENWNWGENALRVYWSNSDRRNLALCSVGFALIVPYLIYKYLDHLPKLQSLSKSKRNNQEEVPLRKRIAYMVDVCFSVYSYAKLLALLSATIFLIVFGGLALYAVGDGNFTEALWHSWTFVADAGNHADRVGTGPRIVSVSISSGGMLIFAMMLGLVSDAISEKVDSLRKGKSEVIESNHVLILGWSNKLGSLLKQLAIANKSIGGGVIVVLAERDKEEMEMDITKLEFDFMGTSVICRSGSPLILADLKKVSVSKARAIIVLASDENADQSDARALRVVLSLTGVKEGLKGHVVVEMSDLDNEPLVKLVGGELIETVVAHDVIGRLMIQCALQPGLAQIWEDILGFENAEFYIKQWPQLDGMSFEDVLISFPDAIPCGIKVAADGGKILLNPEDSYTMKQGDEVLVIAEDDDTYSPGPLPKVRRGLFPKVADPPKYPEKILFCGWRRDIDDMIMVLEAFLAPGSELWIFSEVPEKDRERKLIDGGLDLCSLENLRLVHREGNAVIKRHLEILPLETFDSILILADESLEDSIVHSDSRSLATLLLIRDIQSKRLPYKDTKSNSLRLSGFSHSSWISEMQQASDRSIIISEILDSRTRNLVSVSRISDYVLSNELVSMALAMVAEDKQINRVLEELFAEEGNEMSIKPAEFYLYDQKSFLSMI
ncbi:hypothetical protein MLD38_032226 [Melastoma candidum]|uniref:Uncharacterized protein n=1 Tax=Melastoma candidum TaxID=119954 RepID=A0ACB9M5F3_9MYRT|nr:hypothetical protein MLD38_032226 [Melastoma candidum]